MVALFQIGTILLLPCQILQQSGKKFAGAGAMWVIEQSFSSETCSKLTACSIGFTAHPVQPLVTVV